MGKLQNEDTFKLLDLVTTSCLFETPWTVAYRAPLSMRFFRQKYWSGLPSLIPWDLPDPGINPMVPALQADSLPLKNHLGSPSNNLQNNKKKGHYYECI